MLETRGKIIELFIHIEQLVNKLILEEVQPKDQKWFKEVVLNSSILNFGSKIKILENIAKVEGSCTKNLRKISSIRNYFAHTEGKVHINIDLGEDGKSKSFEVKNMVKVMNSQGKLQDKDEEDLKKEFESLYNELIKYIDKLLVNKS